MKYPDLLVKWGTKCKTLIFWFFILDYNFVYAYVINCDKQMCPLTIAFLII